MSTTSTLNRWKEYDEVLTDSLWVMDRRDTSGAHRAWYWGNFIPQIPRQLMLRYTRAGERVLDPFFRQRHDNDRVPQAGGAMALALSLVPTRRRAAETVDSEPNPSRSQPTLSWVIVRPSTMDQSQPPMRSTVCS